MKDEPGVVGRVREAVSARTAPTHGGAPRTPFALLLIALFGGAMVLLLVLNTASAANEVRRHDIAARDASVAALVQDAQNHVAASAAPANLARAAAALGMVPAGNPAFLVVGADGRIRVMGSPAAASDPPVPVAPQPKPHPSTSAAKKKPSRTASPSPSTSKSKRTPTHHRTPSATPSSKPTPTPTPTSTPTAVVTMPGGPR